MPNFIAYKMIKKFRLSLNYIYQVLFNNQIEDVQEQTMSHMFYLGLHNRMMLSKDFRAKVCTQILGKNWSPVRGSALIF